MVHSFNLRRKELSNRGCLLHVLLMLGTFPGIPFNYYLCFADRWWWSKLHCKFSIHDWWTNVIVPHMITLIYTSPSAVAFSRDLVSLYGCQMVSTVYYSHNHNWSFCFSFHTRPGHLSCSSFDCLLPIVNCCFCKLFSIRRDLQRSP
jgi:hypothetical protein